MKIKTIILILCFVFLFNLCLINVSADAKQIVSINFVGGNDSEQLYYMDNKYLAIQVTYIDNSTEIFPSTKFNWQSSANTIVKVNSFGTIYASQVGPANITATLKTNTNIKVTKNFTVVNQTYPTLFSETKVVSSSLETTNSERAKVYFYFPSLNVGQQVEIRDKTNYNVLYKGTLQNPSITVDDYKRYTFVLYLLDSNSNVITSVEKEITTLNRSEPIIDNYYYNAVSKFFEVTARPLDKNQYNYSYPILYYSFNDSEWQSSNRLNNVNYGDVIKVSIMDLDGNSFTKYIVNITGMERNNKVDRLEVESKYINNSLHKGETLNLKDIKSKVYYYDGFSTDVSNLITYEIPFESSNLIQIKDNVLSFKEGVNKYTSTSVIVKYIENEELVMQNIYITYMGEKIVTDPIVYGTLKDFHIKNDITTYDVQRTKGLDLNTLVFEAIYDNNKKKDVRLDSLTYFIPTLFEKDIVIDKNKVIKFKNDVSLGRTIFITFTYKEGSKTLTEDIYFKKSRDNDVYIVDLSSNTKQYAIKEGDKFDLKTLKFKIYYSDSDVIDIPLSKVLVEPQYKYLSKITYDPYNKTFSFNMNKTQIGEEIVFDFYYVTNNSYVTEQIIFKLEKKEDIPTQTINPYTFSDINNHWAKNYILKLAKENMIVGYQGDKFLPNKNVTRGEVAGFISRYLKLNSTTNVPFIDVREHDWYYEDIAKVYKAGIFKGYSNNTFKPEEEITREELGVILLRVYKYNEKLVDTSNNRQDFADNNKISFWAREEISEVKGLKLMIGKPNNMFCPQDKTTRAEISTILARMLGNN